MSKTPIIIVSGEPNSIFLEIFFKILKKNNFKKPIILIVSLDLFKKQMKKFNFNFKINLLNKKITAIDKIKKKEINIINIDFKFKNDSPKIIIGLLAFMICLEISLFPSKISFNNWVCPFKLSYGYVRSPKSLSEIILVLLFK